MKRFSPSIFLLSTFLVAGCATDEPNPFPDIEVDYVAVEVTVDDDDLSFWDVPHLEKACCRKKRIRVNRS